LVVSEGEEPPLVVLVAGAVLTLEVGAIGPLFEVWRIAIITTAAIASTTSAVVTMITAGRRYQGSEAAGVATG
jgi:hypothetical protein